MQRRLMDNLLDVCISWKELWKQFNLKYNKWVELIRLIITKYPSSAPAKDMF